MSTPKLEHTSGFPLLAPLPIATPVPTAVKPAQSAIALTYEASRGAPKVVAKGKGLIAERIIETARAHGVFVHESRELVGLLMNVNLDQEIPPALYQAVAELLAWLYRIETEAINLPADKV